MRTGRVLAIRNRLSSNGRRRCGAVMLATTCVLTTCTTTLPVAAAQGRGLSAASRTPSLSHVPVVFEENDGQVDGQVAFIARVPGSLLYFARDRIEVTMSKPATTAKPRVKPEPGTVSRPELDKPPAAVHVGLVFVGANPNPQITGSDRQHEKVNYLLGRDPSGWHVNVPTYSRIRYAGLYPGIDLVVYSNGEDQPEYDWVVAPGSDPSRIQFRIDGGGPPVLGRSGDLRIPTTLGDVRETSPVAYQVKGGSRVPVKASYLAHRSDGSFGLQLSPYDHARELVIDPAIVYSSFYGSATGNDFDEGRAITVGSDGSAYITGETASSDFVVSSGVFQSSMGGGNYDAFVMKFSPAGDAIDYSTYLGGISTERGYGIAVDASGDAVVVGDTWSTNFPLKNALQSTDQATPSHPDEAFVSELNATGSALVYSTYWGGSNSTANAVAIDGSANAYVGGWACTGLTTIHPIKATTNTNCDGFITEFNATGSSALFSTYYGGSLGESVNGITVDQLGKIYIAGWTNSTDFPTASAVQPTYSGWWDTGFIAKVDAATSTIVYSTYLGGNAATHANAIAVDGSGYAEVTGQTQATDFPTVNSAQSTFGGGTAHDSFAVRLSPSGSTFAYSTYLGGSNDDVGYGVGVDVDGTGAATVVGMSGSTNFPLSHPVQSTFATTSNTFVHVTVTRLDSDGTVAYSTLLGGSRFEYAQAVALDSSGDAYITGGTTSADYPEVGGAMPLGPLQVTPYRTMGFVTKLQPSGTQALPQGGAPSNSEAAGGGNLCWPCYTKWLREHMNRTGDPVNTENGSLSETVTELGISARGEDLGFTRTYSSLFVTTQGALGFGWTFDAAASLSVDPVTGNVTVDQEDGSTVSFLKQGTAYSPSAPRSIATLVQNADGTFTLTRQGTETLTFSAVGQLTSKRDLNGYSLTYAYDAGSRLASITDSSTPPRSISLGYTGSLLTSITDPIGRTVQFGYNDGAGNLTDVTDVNGGHSHYTYDANHLLTSIGDPRGGLVTNGYDTAGRVHSQTIKVDAGDPTKDRTTTFAYTGDPSSATGGTTTVTDPKGNVVVYQYTYALQTSVTRGAGTPQAATWQYTYDPVTLGLLSDTDPDGHQTRKTYDGRGNALTSTDALGRLTQMRYDALNDPIAVTDPLGVTTTNSYDANGNLASSSRPLVGTSPLQSAVTVFHHSDPTHPGDVTSVTDPDGNSTTYMYDGDGNRVGATDADNFETTYSYNAVGWLTSLVEPRGNVAGCNCAGQYTVTYSYTDPVSGQLDAFGDVRATTDPLGDTSVTSYDADRNLIASTDADHNTTSYAYDLAGEQTALTRADSSVLHTDYWPDGTVEDQIDGKGNRTRYSYDPLGRLVSVSDPMSNTTTYQYDAAGRRTAKIDAQQQATTYAYDAAGEPTSTTYSDGSTPSVTGVTYDADGERTAMTDGTGTSSWTWDTLHRMTSSHDAAGKVVRYGYDLAGHLTSLTFPDGSVESKGYDPAGNMYTIDYGSDAANFWIDEDGNYNETDYPNGDTALTTYDASDRPSQVTQAGWQSNFETFSYGRDGNGQVTTEQDTGTPGTASSTYTYSSLNQLASTNGASYAYDLADNRTTSPSGTVQTYNADDEVVSSSAPISLVTSGRAEDSGSASSLTVPLPVAAQTGDQILAVSTEATSALASAPSGYSTVTTATSGGSSVAVYRRSATGGEQQVTVTYPSSLVAKTLLVAVYRGVDPVNPIEGTTSGSGLLTTTVTTPSVTTSQPTDRLVMAEAAEGNLQPAAWSAPSGMSDVIHENDLSMVSSALADQYPMPVGPSGSRTATFGTTGNLVGVLMALKPVVTTYTYDLRGNRTSVSVGSGPTTTLTYDQEDRLVGYGTTSYAYNGDGLRMRKTVGGTTTPYVYNLAEGLPLILMDGSTRFLYGPQGVPYEQTTVVPPATYSPNVQYLHQDQLGTTRAISDWLGNLLSTFSYDAYGTPTGSTGTTTTPMGFGGEYTDAESGFVYLRARYYDPVTGQFLSRDPLASRTSQPYAYAGDNPVNAGDPSGLFCWPPWSSSCQVDLPGGNCLANGAPTCSHGDTGVANLKDNISDPNPTGFVAAVRDASVVTATWSDIDRTVSGAGNVGFWDWAAIPLDLLPGSGYASGREIECGENLRISPLGNWGAKTAEGDANWAARLPHYHRRIVDPSTGETVPGGSMKWHRPWQGW